MTPVKFKFSNTNGTISLTVPYGELTEKIEEHTTKGNVTTNKRLVSHLIRTNGLWVCKETLLQAFPDLSFEFLSTISAEELKDMQSGFNIFRFRGKAVEN